MTGGGGGERGGGDGKVRGREGRGGGGEGRILRLTPKFFSSFFPRMFGTSDD